MLNLIKGTATNEPSPNWNQGTKVEEKALNYKNIRVENKYMFCI